MPKACTHSPSGLAWRVGLLHLYQLDQRQTCQPIIEDSSQFTSCVQEGGLNPGTQSKLYAGRTEGVLLPVGLRAHTCCKLSILLQHPVYLESVSNIPDTQSKLYAGRTQGVPLPVDWELTPVGKLMASTPNLLWVIMIACSTSMFVNKSDMW